MPEKPKSTAPGGESPKESIIISYPVPDSELPSAKELGASEKEARLKLLSKVSVGLGRLATGRQLDVSGTSDGLIEQARIAVLMSRLHPDTPAYLLIKNIDDGSSDDGNRRAAWMRVDQGDFSTTINPDSEENHGLPPAEDALDAWEAQLPQSNNQPTEQPKPPTNERERLRAALREAGKLGSKAKAESEPPTREDVLAALRGGTTKTSRPAPKPQTREEVLAALRGEYSSPAVEKANSGSDSSVADTESEPPALEDQEESGSSNEQDDSPDELSADKQSPSGSEALKRLAEADTTQLTIRNMAGAAEGLAGVLNMADTLRAPVLFGRIQEFTSGILAMINRFNGAVEEVGGDLPQDEASRLGDRIGEIKRALTVLNNAVAKQGRYGHSNEDYLAYAMKLEDSITELQRFMNVSVKRQENNEQG
ncbi:MAG: hypothetical protein ACFNMB_02415 [Candidatus Saccharimonas sp.]